MGKKVASADPADKPEHKKSKKQKEEEAAVKAAEDEKSQAQKNIGRGKKSVDNESSSTLASTL